MLGDHPIDVFQRTFETKIAEEPDRKGKLIAVSEANIGEGSYTNIIDMNEGKIIGVANYKRNTKNWYLSEVVYTQLQLVLQKAGKDISQFSLKSWEDMHVINKNTLDIVKQLFPKGEN